MLPVWEAEEALTGLVVLKEKGRGSRFRKVDQGPGKMPKARMPNPATYRATWGTYAVVTRSSDSGFSMYMILMTLT